MNVEQIMTKDVATCEVDDTLNDAARIMWERDCGFVPIIENGERRRVAGIVTDRDICMATYTRGQTLQEICVREVMSKGVRSCKPNESIRAVEGRMREAKVHRLPVIDDSDQLLGVISLADIACEMTREVGSEREDVSAAEVGETLAAIRQPRQLAAASAQA